MGCHIKKIFTLLFFLAYSHLEAQTEDNTESNIGVPVSVLQNRFFLKAKRLEVGFVLGIQLNEAYTSTKSYGLRSSFYLSEWLGLEGQFFKTVVSDTDDKKALNKLQYHPIENTKVIISPDPEVNAIHQATDFNIVAAPFYGKLNLIDKMIVYTDIYFTTGLTSLTTDQGNKTGFLFGLGERFYISNKYSFRIDFRDRIFSETRGGKESTRHAWGMDLGGSYFFF